MKQSSPVGENLRKLILISKFYQNFYLENKSVSSVYVYLCVIFLFLCLLCFNGANIGIFCLSKNIGMCACSHQQHCQFGIILVPNQQPIRLDVTFPTVIELTREFMWFIFGRQATILSSNCITSLNASIS